MTLHTPYLEINLAAYQRNLKRIKAMCEGSKVMAVVKADAYGHGLVEITKAAVAAGADMLGVLDIETGLELRKHSIDLPAFAWLHSPQSDFAAAIDAGIELSVSTTEELERIAAAGFATVHLKIDTGLNRNGATVEEWPALLELAERLQTDGRLRVAAVWSHLADAGAEADEAAIEVFEWAWKLAQERGLGAYRHLASSPSAFAHPRIRYEMVRIGVSAFGVSPVENMSRDALELDAVMTLIAEARGPHTLAIGFEHGVSSAIEGITLANGLRITLVEPFQTRLDASNPALEVGQRVELFGAETDVQNWADKLKTVPDEIFAALWTLPKAYLHN